MVQDKTAKDDFQYLTKRNQVLNIVVKKCSGTSNMWYTLKHSPVLPFYFSDPVSHLLCLQRCWAFAITKIWQAKLCKRPPQFHHFQLLLWETPLQFHLEWMHWAVAEPEGNWGQWTCPSIAEPRKLFSFLEVWISSPEFFYWKRLS